MILDTVVKLLQHSTDSLLQIRDNYVQVKGTAEETLTKWDMEPKF
jgi:hypothetical protein